MRATTMFAVLLGLAAAPPVWASYIPCERVSIADRYERDGYRQPWKDAPKLTAKDVPTVAALVKAADKPIAVEGGDFRGQSFSGVELSNICFYDTDFTNTDWTATQLNGVVFSQGKLKGAKFAWSRLRAVRFLDSVLDDVDASGIALTDSTIEGGSFDGLNLHLAVLDNFGLACSLIVGENNCEWPEKKGVDVTEAMLTGGELNVISTEHWDFTGATLDNTVVQLNQIPQFRTSIVKTGIRIGSTGYGTGTYAMLSAPEWRSLVAAWVGQSQSSAAGRSSRSTGIGWLKPGATLVYVSSDLPVAPRWKKTATYRKLLPVIVASSDSTVVVDVSTKNTIAVNGGAMGSNGHMCSVEGSFRYNPKTGWFGARHSAEWRQQFPTANPHADVIRLTPSEVVVEDAHPAVGYPEFASCGARASFLDMQRLDVPQDLISAVRHLPGE